MVLTNFPTGSYFKGVCNRGALEPFRTAVAINTRLMFTYETLQIEPFIMFEEATMMVEEGTTITVNLTSNIFEDLISLNAVDETATLGGKFK